MARPLLLQDNRKTWANKRLPKLRFHVRASHQIPMCAFPHDQNNRVVSSTAVIECTSQNSPLKLYLHYTTLQDARTYSTRHKFVYTSTFQLEQQK